MNNTPTFRGFRAWQDERSVSTSAALAPPSGRSVAAAPPAPAAADDQARRDDVNNFWASLASTAHEPSPALTSAPSGSRELLTSASSTSLLPVLPALPSTSRSPRPLWTEEVLLRARSHCRFVLHTHPLYTITTNMFGTSFSEGTMRPNPRSRGLRMLSGTRTRPSPCSAPSSPIWTRSRTPSR
jgi:hypothetical protein